eukprot:COSAG04_NODE_4478_length_2065_cov_2.803154_2_plen_102_part_00
MNTLWRLGRGIREETETRADGSRAPPPIEAAPLRSMADFATDATFTKPHGDDDLFALRLWRNVEYYQTNCEWPKLAALILETSQSPRREREGGNLQKRQSF